MDVSEPTQEQWKEVLEWCGFRFIGEVWEQIKVLNWSLDRAHELPDIVIINPEGSWVKVVPPIDPNFLIKYAVTRLLDSGYIITIKCIQHSVVNNFFIHIELFSVKPVSVELAGQDLTLTLFWAIWESMKASKLTQTQRFCVEE